MALDLTRVALGLDIQSVDFSSNANILQGVGAPGGDSAEQDAAPIGSIYMRTDAETDNLQVYWKYRTTQNNSTDWRQGTSKQYVDALVQGLSWREPALVLDSTAYADITAAETAANVGDTVDGITIAAGDRLLFTNLTTGNDNVYIVSGSTGAWTFTEDVNLATDGDALMIEQGTAQEEQWVFDGTNWVKISGSNNNLELSYIRDFIGKTAAGAETPTYSSTDIITPSTSLESAIGQLDAAIGPLTFTEQNFVTNGNDVTLNLDAIDIQLGNNTFTSSFIVGSANDITQNLDNLDVAIGNRTYTNDFFVTDGQTITASIDALDTQFGANTFTQQNVVTNGDDVTTSIDNLDVAIRDIVGQSEVIKTTNVTTQTAVDTHPIASVDVAKWIVSCENTGDSTNRYSAEIHAMHDGTTNTDFNRFSVLQLGGAIPGLTFDVDVSAGNMRLLVTSTAAVDVVVKRLAAYSIN